jgi:hypothetical protein
MRPTRLLVAAGLVLVVTGVGAAVSIAAGLPYEFGGRGDPTAVAADFVSGGGTALSPPLLPMVLLAVFAALSPAGGGGARWELWD